LLRPRALLALFRRSLRAHPFFKGSTTPSGCCALALYSRCFGARSALTRSSRAQQRLPAVAPSRFTRAVSALAPRSPVLQGLNNAFRLLRPRALLALFRRSLRAHPTLRQPSSCGGLLISS